MNLTIPFSKEIIFKTNIAEICSISLEHDVSINDNELLGDFIISGDYKNLDVNVDSSPFSHVVPFSISLEDGIDYETLSYDVADFTYDIVDENILKVNISFHVCADKLDRKLDVFESVNDLEINDPEVDNLVEGTLFIENTPDAINEIEPDERNDEKIDDKPGVLSQNDLAEDYITYHVHIVKINETIDSISTEYKIEKDELLEVNDITNLNIGDKIIIPIVSNEE